MGFVVSEFRTKSHEHAPVEGEGWITAAAGLCAPARDLLKEGRSDSHSRSIGSDLAEITSGEPLRDILRDVDTVLTNSLNEFEYSTI